MIEFKTGDGVEITISGVVTDVVKDPVPKRRPYLVVAYTGSLGGPTCSLTVFQDSPDVTVERAKPKGWPPKPGDAWRCDDMTWLYSSKGKFVSEIGGEWTAPALLGLGVPLVLVYRPEVNQ